MHAHGWLEVGHIAHRNINMSLLYIHGRLVNIDEQVLIVGHVAVVQVLTLP